MDGGDAPRTHDTRRAALLARARAGDDRACRRLYEEHRRSLRNLIRRLLGDGRDVDDLLQVVFMRAYAALHRFRGDAALATWLQRIARNTVRDFLRGRDRDRRLRDEYARTAACLRGHIESRHPRTRLEVDELLDRLNPAQRHAYLLHHREQRTVREIAGIEGVAPSTVASRLKRAQTLLEAHARAS